MFLFLIICRLVEKMGAEKIKAAGKSIVIVPTAHVSRKSMELVRETIEKEKPDVVGVELDRQRLKQLMHGKQWQEMQLDRIIKEGKTHLFLINLLLANFQRRIGEDLGINMSRRSMDAQAVDPKPSDMIPGFHGSSGSDLFSFSLFPDGMVLSAKGAGMGGIDPADVSARCGS